MSKQSDALREYFETNGILQRDVCEATGMKSGTVSNILSGRFQISKNAARKLASVYGFSIPFLITGEGSLCPPGTVRITQAQRVSGNGTGIQSINGDQALAMENAQLREQLAQERAEKQRLLGIIEGLTAK